MAYDGVSAASCRYESWLASSASSSEAWPARSYDLMKPILHVSDIHSHPAWLEWLVKEAPGYGLISMSGDTLNLGAIEIDPEDQLARVVSSLKRIEAPLALVSGNHDELPLGGFESATWLHRLRAKNVWVDGDTFIFGGHSFRCVGWCETLPDGPIEDFLIVHVPPFGIPTSTVAGGVSHGCEDLRQQCLSGGGARWILSGHIHSPLAHWSQLRGSTSLNPGKGVHGSIPNHMVIHLVGRRVTHHAGTASGVRVTGFSY